MLAVQVSSGPPKDFMDKDFNCPICKRKMQVSTWISNFSYTLLCNASHDIVLANGMDIVSLGMNDSDKITAYTVKHKDIEIFGALSQNITNLHDLKTGKVTRFDF